MVGIILNASRICTEDPNVSFKCCTLENIFDKELCGQSTLSLWVNHSRNAVTDLVVNWGENLEGQRMGAAANCFLPVSLSPRACLHPS